MARVRVEACAAVGRRTTPDKPRDRRGLGHDASPHRRGSIRATPRADYGLRLAYGFGRHRATSVVYGPSATERDSRRRRTGRDGTTAPRASPGVARWIKCVAEQTRGRAPTARPDQQPPTAQGGCNVMIPDERPERIAELWAHLFEGLEGYLVTFTGQQSARTDARPNELDAPQQRSWRWPTQQTEAAEYLLEQSQAGRDAYFGVHLFRRPSNRKAENAAEGLALWVGGVGGPRGWDREFINQATPDLPRLVRTGDSQAKPPPLALDAASHRVWCGE